jgi:cytochrome c peroxidase
MRKEAPLFAKSILRKPSKAIFYCLLALSIGAALAGHLTGDSNLPNQQPFSDPTGVLTTYSTTGALDLSNPFFQSLGTNGRSCGSCHQPSDAMTVTPPHTQARFADTQGLDPIFRPVDGAVCPDADVSTLQARQSAYSLLLNKGLIRVSISVPANAEFVIKKIRDPYNCAETTKTQPAMYRRPLPATNLNFLSTVMSDERETFKNADGTFKPLSFDLGHQAVDATLIHAQAAQAPSDTQVQQIVAFETALFTAQASDNTAGQLNTQGATGGAVNLSSQSFYLGINDPLGGNPTGAPFDPNAMTLYTPWANLGNPTTARIAARESVARGEDLFNTFSIPIFGVAGINDQPGIPSTLLGTCTTCHDTPNVGDHSLSVPLNIGVTAYPAVPALDISGLPVYTIVCNTDNSVIQTTDPGRALISGQCADIGKTKGPILRGLAGRAPYFHNGSAATLLDVVNFYDQRFNLNLSSQQKTDLVAFLNTL